MHNPTKKDLKTEDILRNLNPDYARCQQCNKRRHIDNLRNGLCTTCLHSMFLGVGPAKESKRRKRQEKRRKEMQDRKEKRDLNQRMQWLEKVRRNSS